MLYSQVRFVLLVVDLRRRICLLRQIGFSPHLEMIIPPCDIMEANIIQVTFRYMSDVVPA